MYQDIKDYHFKEDAEAAWRMIKWGKFSASEIHNLMSRGRDQMFGEGAWSYIHRIAREAMTAFNDDENNMSKAMFKGKMKEAEAFNYYRQIIGINSLEYFGGGNPLFEHYTKDSGASPDCLYRRKNEVRWGAEFKCPTSKVHWDYIRNIKDQFDLQKIDPLYYGQCQFGMMTFKTDLWHWCTYNEYYPVKWRMHLIEIKTDISYQTNLKVRIAQGTAEKYKLINEMK